ncbi:CheR family methyltransferase [Gloeothece verrucosa]|uniref:protein-glutamate O-methyltransferase n=1 Tax=Gloeothece verrucosa (strain PCC 7822) TaxID=497965 RepID=E0UKT2_GLOV7|nr:protein-glutamate O-methyltransferase CheR [Gloeothece verrucosa]ADN17562.1 MCP methyltransferase, CheR-type [Gloeothece verrucosa PCC 7822]
MQPSPPQLDPEFEALLEFLKSSRGCDLTNYKRSTLKRRFRVRMEAVNINNYQSYFKYLESNAQEYIALLNEIFVNFTYFFRDKEAWDYLAQNIIPQIVSNKQADEPIRIWSAGCAAGQEIYSLLILFAEIVGIEFCLKRVKAFATDVDEAAISQARQRTYSKKEIAGIPPNLLKKYFTKIEKNYIFERKLRQSIIFGCHDLAKDAPISKIDLLLCRNVLMYFEKQTQEAILTRFHFALKNTGFLFLGNIDLLIHERQIFTPINLKHRMYVKEENLEIENLLIL